ncbi:MAG: cytochrome C oxidase subunit III [Planctomycetes bacterium]|nr:cytochrome C oxidase subunit III [Planctomycetota bacterium]
MESIDLSPGEESRIRADANQTLVAILMAMAAMLFAAFTASYAIRRTSADWIPVPFPSLLWLNTALLIASSGTLELARDRPVHARRWLRATLALGLAFAAGQILAWTELAAAGAFSPGNPHRAFFLLLTAVHGAHLVGAFLACGAALGRSRSERLGPCAAWWHFVGALWVYVVIVLRFF